jgi:hypothetical protein
MNLRDGLLTMVGAPNFETTLGIAGLHFEIGTFPGAAPDQFDLASGAATPGTGNGVVGRTMTRQRVSDAVGCPKSAASAGRRQRRMAMPMVPEPSGARLKGGGRPSWRAARLRRRQRQAAVPQAFLETDEDRLFVSRLDVDHAARHKPSLRKGRGEEVRAREAP